MNVDLTPFLTAPGFTFFHTRVWLDALLSAFPRWRDASQITLLPDGRRVWLPLLETARIGVWRWLDAMPFGFFGVPVVDHGTVSRDDLSYIVSRAGQRAGWLAINLDPGDSLARAEMLPIGVTPLTTHLLKLNTDFATVERGFTKTMRYDMRRAEREGVTFRRGSGDADFQTYFDLTRRAAERWHLAEPPFPRALYAALARLPTESVSLWLAEFEGRAIGGLINVQYTPERVLHWASALDPAYAHLNPTKLLQREALREACERGATVYNLGPSVGFDGAPLEGVRQAKEALGATPHDYTILIVMNTWALRARAVRDKARTILMRR